LLLTGVGRSGAFGGRGSSGADFDVVEWSLGEGIVGVGRMGGTFEAGVGVLITLGVGKIVYYRRNTSNITGCTTNNLRWLTSDNF
jgi:hypothetical protein